MNALTLHSIFQKVSIFFFALSFMFVSVYVPQPLNKVDTAEAAWATAPNQVADFGQQALILAKDVAIMAYAAADDLKEYILDGLAWDIAKLIISQMTADIVNWINRGFEGSPMFVQDIRRYLVDAADVLMGSYLQEVGGLASFVCAPFRIDIQVALNLAYTAARRGHLYGSCTLTGALENIDNFLSGSGAFFDGGWDAWYGVTARPQTHTPYGSLLNAEAQASIRILNMRGEQFGFLGFGEGFISGKVCEVIFSAGANREECMISTPGQVIEQALTFQLSSGPRSLIAADEINEIIGALLGQIAIQALDGTAGLLGLTDDSGYTQPLTPEVITEAGVNELDTEGLEESTFADGIGIEQQNGATRRIVANFGEKLDEFVESENHYLDLLDVYEDPINSVCNDVELGTLIEDLVPSPIDRACEAAEAIPGIRDTIGENLLLIEDVRTQLAEAVAEGIDLNTIMTEFDRLTEPLHDSSEVQSAENIGLSIISGVIDPQIALEQDFLARATEQLPLLQDKCLYPEAVETDVRISQINRNLRSLQNVKQILIDDGTGVFADGEKVTDGNPENAVEEYIRLLNADEGGLLHTPETMQLDMDIWIELGSEPPAC